MFDFFNEEHLMKITRRVKTLERDIVVLAGAHSCDEQILEN